VRLIGDILGAFSDPGETFTLGKLSASAGDRGPLQRDLARQRGRFRLRRPTEFQYRKTHIVCGVAASDDPAALHLACSAAFSSRHLQYDEYFERHHPHPGRWSNDSIPVAHQVVVAPNFRWRVTLAERAG
jgi:hypothetical protein